MEKKLFTNVLVLLVMTGMLLTISCAKKTISSDSLTTGNESKITQEEKAAREAALKAEELERQKQNTIEEQRLKDEALRNHDAAEKKVAKERFENQDIHFAYDSSELTPIARMLLKEKFDWLSLNPHTAIKIEGHCDERGTTEYNLALGEKRALAVRNYLQDLGIAEARMNVISYGEEKPLLQDKNEASWAKNRRAHFVCL